MEGPNCMTNNIKFKGHKLHEQRYVGREKVTLGMWSLFSQGPSYFAYAYLTTHYKFIFYKHIYHY